MASLVTGAHDRVAAVAALLRDQGAGDVLTASAPDELDGLDLSGGLDHYVQLPVAVRPEGENLVGRVRSFLSAGLITRFALTEKVLPALNAGAGVVIVSGSTAGDAALPDDRNSRLAFLHVLAHAVRAETGDRDVRVGVVSGFRSDADIVAYATRGGSDPTAAGEQGEQISAKQYQDWRTEMMGLATDQV